MNSQEFTSLSLAKGLLENLSSLGYLQMTPIQAQSLPPMLAGKDVIGRAKTGSGKTAAFGLALLNRLHIKKFKVQALVLCPTRELADQVASELRRLARGVANTKVLTLCGGMALGPQVGSLEHGAHIVVGTPGRIEAHLRKNTLDLSDLKMLVLDEADRMLDMGFQVDLEKILKHVPTPRQTLLFSATFPDEIQQMSTRVMVDPLTVTVEEEHDQVNIEQHFHVIDGSMSRLKALRILLLHYQPKSAIVFCTTRVETQEVADDLKREGFNTLPLHGDMDQAQRDQSFVLISNNSVCVLVATDVAARGLDIEELDLVINYHLAHDVEVHVHRVGRTGRAGSSGIACTLYKANQQYKLDELAEYLGTSIKTTSLPPSSVLRRAAQEPTMETLRIDGGKKQKLRPGDILGALTGENGVAAKQVGKINVFSNRSFVAVEHSVAKHALRKLSKGKLKGKTFRVRRIFV